MESLAYKQIRVSDLSGNVLAEDDVVTVVVRTAGKVFDCSAEEISGLKRVNNVVELELRHADGRTEEILVSKTEFDKLVPASVLEAADGVRGRRTNFRPSLNGNGG